MTVLQDSALTPAPTHPKLRTPGRVRVVVVVAAAAFALAGCSSTSSSNSSTSSTPASSSAVSSAPASSASYPAGKEQICGARDQLKTSLGALVKPSLLLGGTDAIKAAVATVKTDLDAVVAAAKTDYKPEVTAMQSALQQLETAVGSLGSGNAGANLTAVGSAIAAMGTSGTALFAQLTTSCGS